MCKAMGKGRMVTGSGFGTGYSAIAGTWQLAAGNQYLVPTSLSIFQLINVSNLYPRQLAPYSAQGFQRHTQVRSNEFKGNAVQQIAFGSNKMFVFGGGLR